MSNVIEYKGYLGSIEADMDEGSLYGRVLNMDGGLMYEGETLPQLVANMHGVVDAYLSLCEEQGVHPRGPFSGKIALRVDPVLHARLVTRAEAAGVSMNTLIIQSIEQAS